MSVESAPFGFVKQAFQVFAQPQFGLFARPGHSILRNPVVERAPPCELSSRGSGAFLPETKDLNLKSMQFFALKLVRSKHVMTGALPSAAECAPIRSGRD
jgi:hypothetical protein